MLQRVFILGNRLFENCYPLYYPLYSFYKAVTDREERKLLCRWVERGDTVVDVGANIGTYSRYLAGLVGPEGKVVAFEPAATNFKYLQRNTVHLPQVTTINAAVGEKSGQTKLYLSPELNVDHQMYDNGEGRSSVAVNLVSLDAFFKPATKVHLLKIDVQGYELQVLKGAKRLIEENPQIKLILEFWPCGLQRSGNKPGDLFDLLASYGMKCQEIGKLNSFIELQHDMATLERYLESDQYTNIAASREI
jgi:FkbM family methyltransferase